MSVRTVAVVDVKAFARLAGVEAAIRGTTLSVFPLVMYRTWGSAAVVLEARVGIEPAYAALQFNPPRSGPTPSNLSI